MFDDLAAGDVDVVVGNGIAAEAFERRVRRDHFTERGADLHFVETQQNM
jgi:hypothetical protein